MINNQWFSTETLEHGWFRWHLYNLANLGMTSKSKGRSKKTTHNDDDNVHHHHDREWLRGRAPLCNTYNGRNLNRWCWGPMEPQLKRMSEMTVLDNPTKAGGIKLANKTKQGMYKLSEMILSNSDSQTKIGTYWTILVDSNKTFPFNL